jgi:gliding motility-associated-like protein
MNRICKILCKRTNQATLKAYLYNAFLLLHAKRRQLFLVLTAGLLFCCNCFGQGVDRFWIFGHQNGLDFATSPPTFFQSSLESVEGCATVSDNSGNLLFYSNGNKVWDALGNVMPNGNGILGNGASYAGLPGSSAQGVVIVQHPGNSNQYYLFTLDATEDIIPPYPGYLRYSIIDMALNGGLGDVLASTKNISIDSNLTELMTVTKGSGCFVWLLAHRRDNNEYVAFKIDALGVSAPVISYGIWTGTTGGGQIKISPDRTRVALGTSGLPNRFEMASFNYVTGVVNNAILIDSIPTFGFPRYGFCFSPNSSKLYVTEEVGGLVQYDVSAFPNAAAILSSKVMLNNSLFFYGLRNAPDGKIYVARNYEPYLGVINSPDATGIACNFNAMGLSQPVWSSFPGVTTTYGYGLGSDVISGLYNDTLQGIVMDTTVCTKDSLKLFPSNNNFDQCIWDDGTTDSTRYVHNSGTYWLYRFQDCTISVDTFHVTIVNSSGFLGGDTILCPNITFVLKPGITGLSYLWQDGSTGDTFIVNGEGVYYVTIDNGICIFTDTINVKELHPYLKITEPDTVLCNDTELQLHAEASPDSVIHWNTGVTGQVISINMGGLYTAYSENICGRYSDSVFIKQEDCTCLKFIPNSFSPNNDLLNDRFRLHIGCPVVSFSFSVFDRFGERVFITSRPEEGWDGSYKGKPCDIGTYFYYVEIKDLFGNKIGKKGDVTLIR